MRITTHTVPSVNESTEKESPEGTLDQLGTVLPRLIAAVAQTADDEVVFFAKYDIKDGFWRMSVEEGAEYNFAYVMPQAEGEPIRIVIPTQLQMGWTESPSYFSAAKETARDLARIYARADRLEPHSLEEYTQMEEDFKQLPSGELSNDLSQCFKVMSTTSLGPQFREQKRISRIYPEPCSILSTTSSRRALTTQKTTPHR